MRYLDVTIDYAFKRVFGSPESKPILISFLHGLLQNKGAQRRGRCGDSDKRQGQYVIGGALTGSLPAKRPAASRLEPGSAASVECWNSDRSC